ncbi:peptidase family M1-domain-containing protein [Dichomitus squalens]|uniref:Aminopeptidase n=1 Tax=Dichomitus squalens TaxID=114155 RepID=A0A4Q9MPI9_9APHY|nr:peptidase family M1-domain-containing protein [Dichomitus squalens]
MPSSSAAPKDASDLRLPTDLKPTHYDLTVWTDLETNKFEGIVHVDLQVIKETSKVVLNTANLQLGEASLHSDVLQSVQNEHTREFDEKHERGTFYFSKALPAKSQARLSIPFKGELTGDMMGYYRSTGGKNGEFKYTLTQFEPTAARRAFPCWDEPLLKATVAVTLVSRVNSVNLSNMPAISEEVYRPDSVDQDSWLAKKMASLPDAAGQWKVTRFDTTPPVSTYLIAYANGPFVYLEDSYKSPLSGKVRPLRIYTTPDVISQAQFALDIKRKVLPLYEQVFDIEYPLPKLDTLVANDFDAGAMENWGLITGRTTAFLLDPASADIHSKQNIATTQSHEVAHMWFGNITTMEWWDNLYLNEGFATLVGEKIILGGGGRVFPEWKLDSEFLTTNFFQARSLDAKLSSHPIEVECPDANMINQIFDSLSYAKAASVLRMLASYVGEDRFLKGVSIYLKKRTYKNSVTKDLWEGIQAATDLDIPNMMDNWVKKMGYPVVTVTEKEGGIHLRQDRFLETGPADPKDNETIWTIPVNLLTVGPDGKAVVNNDILLNEREKFIPLDTSKPYKLNADTTGFYATQYPPERLAKLGQQAVAENSPFSLSDRIGLVFDALALAKAGYAPVSSALELISILKTEKEHLVWSAIATNISLIVSTWYENNQVVDQLNALRRELFVPLVKQHGFDYSDSDTYDVQQLRTTAIEQAADAGDPWVVKELTSRFDHFLKTGDDSKIPSDLTGVVFRTAVREGGRSEWEAIKRVVLAPKNPYQGLSAMRAMGASKDLGLAEETFQFILNEARDQDTFYYAGGLQRNFVTRKFVAEKFKEHFATFEKRYAGNFGLIRWTEICFTGLSSEKDYEETSAFFKGKDTSKFDMALKQTLDSIKARAAWVKRSTGELTQWLNEHRSKL